MIQDLRIQSKYRVLRSKSTPRGPARPALQQPPFLAGWIPTTRSLTLDVGVPPEEAEPSRSAAQPITHHLSHPRSPIPRRFRPAWPVRQHTLFRTGWIPTTRPLTLPDGVPPEEAEPARPAAQPIAHQLSTRDPPYPAGSGPRGRYANKRRSAQAAFQPPVRSRWMVDPEDPPR